MKIDMTTTKTQQAVALAKQCGLSFRNEGEYSDRFKFSCFIDAYERQIIDRLAAETGVMPEVYAHWAHASEMCDPREVREALAALQAKHEKELREAREKFRQFLRARHEEHKLTNNYFLCALREFDEGANHE
jgi:hypothetical protein